MKKNYILVGVLVIIVSLFWVVNYSRTGISLAGVPLVPSYNSGSSTAYTIWPHTSRTISDQRGGRGGIRICNTSATNKTFLSYSSTVITGTTTAQDMIPANSCLQIDRDLLYTGVIQAINETATSTVLVTEFIGS